MFVANPNKTRPIIDILVGNRDKLLKYLTDFHSDKGEMHEAFNVSLAQGTLDGHVTFGICACANHVANNVKPKVGLIACTQEMHNTLLHRYADVECERERLFLQRMNSSGKKRV